MGTVDSHIHSANDAICENIATLAGNRALLSQNLLAQLRNLVEAVAVRVHTNRGDAEYAYPAIKPALAYVRSQGKYSFLGKFHKLIEISASHYTLDGDASERLMLKYYEYLHRVRGLLRDAGGTGILANLEDFPVDLDTSLGEYHRKIAGRVDDAQMRQPGSKRSRYYIHRAKPFFVGGKVYYEVTFCGALNRVSKFDRIIAFTDVDMTDKYAANLTLLSDSIEVLGQTMPITIIRAWEVSVRPCEFDNFARLFGNNVRVQSGTAEYQRLMHYLTTTGSGLIDLVDLPDEQYGRIKALATERTQKPAIFPALDAARSLIQSGASGGNVVRYLMLRMKNQILKAQYSPDGCGFLSGLRIKFGCKPFDVMPFCTSLPGHNPRYAEIAESISPSGRTHELLARYVKNNVEQRGILYTPVAELERFENLGHLIAQYNGMLYYKHQQRRLERDLDHVFLKVFEDDTVAIINKLQERASTGIEGYSAAVAKWLDDSPPLLDDPVKREALKTLFSQSRVALIYGAAGTGKSTMVDYVAKYFNEKSKLFLAHTNPAVDNLKRKVTASNATFRTISSQIGRTRPEPEYDLLVIDECSTVSNSDLVKVLEGTSFRLLVLVGDVYQIEAIQFGNWFGIARSFIPQSAVFELTTPFRTRNAALLSLWGKVRAISDDITEVIARGGYSAVLDESLFQGARADEVILCLNYDGLYGINNINRFLQSSNPNGGFDWNVSVYKVGDPVLFNESERFRPVIYNNLKGKIVGIERSPGKIQFDVELDRSVDSFDAETSGLTWVSDSVVRFDVYELESSDEDDDSLNTTVPFQVAYAVSIHKAQGLEYDSVKVVITHDNEDSVSHNVFYTAITRTRDQLRIYWTPETQHKILGAFERKINHKDVSILSSRKGLTPRP